MQIFANLIWKYTNEYMYINRTYKKFDCKWIEFQTWKDTEHHPDPFVANDKKLNKLIVTTAVVFLGYIYFNFTL